jgi:hypothetical protein
MQIQRAANLGLMQQRLGIDRNARISLKFTRDDVTIWDLAAGTVYTVDALGNVTEAPFQVRKLVQDIIAESDEQLKKRLSETWETGRDEERETIFTELIFRGISPLGW